MTRWLPLVLLGVVGLAHAPALSGDLVWDDVILIRDNPALHTLAGTVEAAFGDFFAQSAGQPESGFLRPVPTLLNGLTYAAFGADPAPYRATNWALHLLTVFLLLRLFRAFGLGAAAAAVGAGLFGVHPLQSESVAFISGRTDLLAALFFVSTVLLYLRARRGGRLAALGAAVTCLLALGSKEIAFALPVVLLGYEWAQPERRWRASLPVLGVCAAALVWRVASGVEPVGRLYFPAQGAPVAALELVAHYTRLALWPSGQRVLYDHLGVGQGWSVGATVGLLVVVGGALAAWALRRRAPLASLGLVWVGASLLPVLHLVPIAAVAAERYLYLPLAGLGLLVALAVRSAPRVAPVAAVLLLAASVATASRSADWHDEVTLWGVEVGRPDASYKAWQNLAVALAERGQLAPARGAIHQAFARHDGPVVWRNLVRITLANPGGLGAAERQAFVGVALARPVDPAALARWPERLRHSGYPDLAAAIDRLLRTHGVSRVP